MLFMKATKIKMVSGCGSSNNLLEIDSIYIDDCNNPGYFKKDALHNYLNKNPGSIQVDIYPYPDIVPAISKNGEKYVKSISNSTTNDNLLSLPRE